MALSLGKVLIEFGVDIKDLKKGVGDVKQQLDSIGPSASKGQAGVSGLTGSFIKANAIIAGVEIAVRGMAKAIETLAIDSIKMAIDIEESQNLVAVSFGDMKDEVESWSKSLQTNLGLNRFEMEKMAGTTFNMTTSMGVARDAAFDMSTGTAQLAADMASFFNLPIEDAFTKLQAGLTGEVEPLKRLGILVDENTTKQAAYRNGLATVGSELTQVQKVQARYLAIMQQTANAQGDLARTITSPANAIRLLNAQFEMIQATIGQAFMPVIKQITPILLDAGRAVAKWVDDNKDRIAEFAKSFATFVLSIISVASGMAAKLLEISIKIQQAFLDLTDWLMRNPLFKIIESYPELFGATGFAVKKMLGVIRGAHSDWAEFSQNQINLEKEIASGLRFMESTADKALKVIVDGTGKAAAEQTVLQSGIKTTGSVQEAMTKEAIKALKDYEEAWFKVEQAAIEAAEKMKKEAFEKIMKAAEEADDQFGKMIQRTLIPSRPGIIEAGGQVKGTISDLLLGVTPGIALNPIIKSEEKATEKATEWKDALGEVAHMFDALGIGANSFIGQLVRSSVVFGKMIQDFKKTGKFMGGAIGEGDIGGAVSGVAGGIAGVAAGTNKRTRGARVAGGALAGATAGAQVAGPMGAIVGAGVGALVGLLRNPLWAKIAKQTGKMFGVEISDGLAKAIEAQAKKLKLGAREASLLNIGKIVEEQGISGATSAKFVTGFKDLLDLVKKGAIPMEEGLKGISEAFGSMAGKLRELGVSGSVQIGDMVQQMRKLGLVSEETKQVLNAIASEAKTNLGGFFDFLSKKTNLTKEEASSALPVLSGMFAAALQSSGSLAGVMSMLPESFDALFQKLGQIFGGENAVFNELSRYYGFVKQNQEQLAALDSLAKGYLNLVELGIVNKSNVLDFAESFRVQFDSIIAKTGDETMALISMGPQIGMLLQSFQAMGVQVPQWLLDISAKAKEAGASLTPPESAVDILGQIRDILGGIASALGVVSAEARRAASDIGSIPEPRHGGGGGGRDREAAHGFDSIVSSPTRLTVGDVPGHPERVTVTPAGGRGGGGNINITVNAPPFTDADAIARELEKYIEHILVNKVGNTPSILGV